MHTYIYTYIHVHVCMYVHTSKVVITYQVNYNVNTYNTYIHTCICTYIHAFFIYTCIHRYHPRCSICTCIWDKLNGKTMQLHFLQCSLDWQRTRCFISGDGPYNVPGDNVILMHIHVCTYIHIHIQYICMYMQCIQVHNMLLYMYVHVCSTAGLYMSVFLYHIYYTLCNWRDMLAVVLRCYDGYEIGSIVSLLMKEMETTTSIECRYSWSYWRTPGFNVQTTCAKVQNCSPQ